MILGTPRETGSTGRRAFARRIVRNPSSLLVRAACLVGLAVFAGGCSLSRYSIDPGAIAGARLALAQSDSPGEPSKGRREDDFYYTWERWDEEAEQRRRESEAREEQDQPGLGSVILGEALAIFPGVLFHGVGHLYAGDHRTFRQLSRIGGLGYGLTIVGGGLVYAGYEVQQEEVEIFGQDFSDGFAYSLYGTGGAAGGIGVFYILTAWFYDMIDTPRAVRSGGRPPPRSSFIDSMDLLE